MTRINEENWNSKASDSPVYFIIDIDRKDNQGIRGTPDPEIS